MRRVHTTQAAHGGVCRRLGRGEQAFQANSEQWLRSAMAPAVGGVMSSVETVGQVQRCNLLSPGLVVVSLLLAGLGLATAGCGSPSAQPCAERGGGEPVGEERRVINVPADSPRLPRRWRGAGRRHGEAGFRNRGDAGSEDACPSRWGPKHDRRNRARQRITADASHLGRGRG